MNKTIIIILLTALIICIIDPGFSSLIRNGVGKLYILLKDKFKKK